MSVNIANYSSNCVEQKIFACIPWTEEEHKTFLVGLNMLGKGDWRGISREFVGTRTPTQLTPSNKKRRSSLFDALINDTEESSEMSPVQPDGTYEVAEEINPLPLGNYLASSSSATQMAVSRSGAFLPTSVAAKWPQQRHLPGSNFMVSHESPALSTPSCSSSTADSILMEATDLELTIGLPKSLDSAKLCSRASNLTDAGVRCHSYSSQMGMKDHHLMVPQPQQNSGLKGLLLQQAEEETFLAI
ncbi:hypothetical protein ACLOJK_027303 [Asimina triloba]